MKIVLTPILFFFGLLTINAQTLESPALDETSGLLFYNNKLITHNDSGDNPKLYEINTTTGNISRTVTITNATNVDWEDIAQDASYIYIGDIGNNNGNRTDLKIYKILKSDYDDADDTATAEILAYSYANQLDFTEKPNDNNWDAEGLISFGEKLLIFSKNWADNTVNVYSIPKTSGTHSASLVSTYNIGGLITGAETSPDESVIYLTGYTESLNPFMYTIHSIPSNSLDIFSGTTSEKINIVSTGNQVEAIAFIEITPTKHRLYISNEKFQYSFFTLPAMLRTVEVDAASIILDIKDQTKELSFTVFPNPFDKTLKLSEKVDEIIIYDLLGRMVTQQQFVEELSLENLYKGIYIAHIKINNSTLVRKIMKK